jgi:branched-chain amino acid transport system permease protein
VRTVSEVRGLRHGWVVVAGGLGLVLVVLPALLSLMDQSYPFRLAELSMIFVILAASLNLATGTAGLVSLGHAAFYAVGAYAAGLLSATYGVGLEVSLPASVLVTGGVAFLVAIPAIRLVRIFFTVATLSVGEIINLVLLNWDDLTHGPMGLRGVPPMRLFGWDLSGRLATYYVIAIVTILAVWALHRLTHSYYGNALRALREDEQSAGAMGINVAWMKIGVFSISGGVAGAAGCLLAHSTGFISPDMFQLDQSILILTMAVVGGLGSVPGAVVGAFILILAPEFTRAAGHYRTVLVGLVLYLSILLMPKGLLAEGSALRFAHWMGVGRGQRGDERRMAGWE